MVKTDPLQTRPCGAVHPKDGELCWIPVYTEPASCSCKEDPVYQHEGPHESVTADGVVTHRWEAVMVVKDLPFDGYKPRAS